ncbi:MAG TPA: hypothetical protein VLH12_08445 [Usitatibacter sp.]|nr:hypothetical protein [Usitatibacter sp.]
MPDYLIKTALTAGPIDDRKPIVVERIVRAKNQSQAIRHVVEDTLSVDLATIDDAMRIAQAGGKVETASDK